MPDTLTQRWTFTQPSPLGETSSSFELTADGLHYRCDAPLGGGSESLRWDAIAEAATAVVDLPAGKGGPDMVRWMPGRLEWLLVSRSGPGAKGFMRPLPASEARDAIVAGLRERLGTRWVGEGLPLEAVQKRFRISSHGDGLKVAGLVAAVIGVLILMLVLFALLSALLLLPAGFALGGWLFYRGLAGLRDALQVANTPTAKVASAAMGLVELEGRAVPTGEPSPAGVTGRPSVWWDVGVDAWYKDDRKGGRWRQVMARHGGSGDTLVLEDATGRVPVWLRDADVLLEDHRWETGKDVLPPRGVALLEGTAFDWNGGARLRVREQRMEADGPMYVLGTLDEGRHLPADGEERGIAAIVRSLRTGTWRAALVRALPPLVRAPVYIALSYVDMLTGIGRGGERARRPQDAPRPAIGENEVLVWKGRARRAFIVSDRRETEALAHLRKRSLWSVAVGVAVLCYCLYELINVF